ncbi:MULTISPECIES: O-antigen ligase family protein [unclassified Photobacterium]|uniref:O-antigen ligase family protein n=1 Tax=unclassified Photobacterium TaxID=2628852 RepID=UPI001EE0978A|nr:MULTISPECIES: O-antigen ligase family protein [unclassified Photobacterium]MCG3862856.1 O-antigen ligase family protein [Photobacterium sp. Ph6]MCG3874279.1 O-antigen ligase family protein [Photobacterium sp. Ph5]
MLEIKKDTAIGITASFLITSALVWNTFLGSVAALLFILVGGSVIIFHLHRTLLGIQYNWIVMVYPILALLSVLWSQYPEATLRSAIQFILTTVIGIAVVYNIKKEQFFVGLSCSVIIIMALSLVSHRVETNGMTGETVLIGYLGSKNFLAQTASIGFFVGFGLFYTLAKNKVEKIIGLLSILFSIAVLLKAKSLGATVTSFGSIFACFCLYHFSNLAITQRAQKATVNLLYLLALCVIVFVYIIFGTPEFNHFMVEIGKDPTLTSRTLIWAEGDKAIAQAPILGAGYDAIFQIGNPIGEAVWKIGLVPPGVGFNFHNMFVHWTVHFGYVGLIIYLLILARLLYNIRLIACGHFQKSDFIPVAYFVFFISRSVLEVDWFAQFTLAHVMFCYCWIALESSAQKAKQLNKKGNIS